MRISHVIERVYLIEPVLSKTSWWRVLNQIPGILFLKKSLCGKGIVVSVKDLEHFSKNNLISLDSLEAGKFKPFFWSCF